MFLTDISNSGHSSLYLEVGKLLANYRLASSRGRSTSALERTNWRSIYRLPHSNRSRFFSTFPVPPLLTDKRAAGLCQKFRLLPPSRRSLPTHKMPFPVMTANYATRNMMEQWILLCCSTFDRMFPDLSVTVTPDNRVTVLKFIRYCTCWTKERSKQYI